MNLKILLLCGTLICLTLTANAKLPLLFPGGGTWKWIIGFGIPWNDLTYETLSSGMVWRFKFKLPGNINQLKHRGPGIHIERNFGSSTSSDDFLLDSDTEVSGNQTSFDAHNVMKHRPVLSSYRWAVYKSLEGVAERMGLKGRDCVLKSICEAAEDPFHYGNGLWQELLYILLTPSSSADKLSTHSDNEYYYAENVGHSGAKCDQVFKGCNRSLLDHFSNFHELTDQFAKYL